MKFKQFISKAWYFIFPILTAIITPIINAIVLSYVGEENIEAFLNWTISIKIILPIGLTLIVLIICLIVFIIKLKASTRHISPADENFLNNIVRSTVNTFPEIECIHAYQSFEKDDEKDKYILTRFVTGYADERVETNVLFQTYYYFQYSYFKKIKKFASYYTQFRETTDHEIKTQFEIEFKKQGNELCQQIIDRLNLIDAPENISIYDCELYRILNIILTVIQDNPVTSCLQNAQIESILESKKRNGILGSIILKNIYIFKNTNSLTKNRIYFSLPCNLGKKYKNIILVATIRDEDNNETSTIVSNLCNEVYSYLKNITFEQQK